jgi:hypothetical protein
MARASSFGVFFDDAGAGSAGGHTRRPGPVAKGIHDPVHARLQSTSGSVATALVISPVMARADDRTDCAAGNATLLTGAVIASPTWAPGKSLQAIFLTHTHIRICADSDGKQYDLAVDDVFATGYEPQFSVVPPPLSSIVVGQHVEACGLPYSAGMHWVHTNCGDAPTPQDPNGWLKVIDAAGIPGPNLEDSQKYCYLWPKGTAATHHRRRHGDPGSN